MQTDSGFQCSECQELFANIEQTKKHLCITHPEIIQSALNLIDTKKEAPVETYFKRRCAKGKSDPISLSCDCNQNGTVLLYYNYTTTDSIKLAKELESLGTKLGLTGKIRVGSEGYNITVAGSTESCDEWVKHFLDPEIMPGIDKIGDKLDEFILKFFKPSKGCVHVFDGLSVKIVSEICPLGIPAERLPKIPCTSEKVIDYILNPKIIELGNIISLPPAEYHQELLDAGDDCVILDTRNYYESKIGLFKNAVAPAIRKFSSLPQYIKKTKDDYKDKKILTYCTGGIRCEKASRFIQAETGSKVVMLEGGIHNYLEWASKTNTESLFQGVNYVFDARQSLGDSQNLISNCQICGEKSGNYKKCVGDNCHLLITCCPTCGTDGLYCCQDCKEHQTICSCEEKRRRELAIQ
ncbi:thiosulfate sulfurtransferase (rhodanese)-like domain-containing protein 2 [Boothiomyces macroporosus]|uniref:Thiosulfate sulfurtransferase (Rhodanese)-like domain-containing protein 2 n=1 Tax=Boothiomyces macroporosus TaxID=261099 RepID=A0AAD5UF40_9FUNG|nr:thiosulfate sulfurtransferase (rhodanese)-like domain-containing protein 2 [Boothiomyces macroporosus]